MKQSTRRFLQLWLACVLLSAGSVVAIAFALGAALAPVERAAALRLLEASAPLPHLSAIIGLVVLAFLASWLNRHYFHALAAAAEATALVALANSAQRVAAQGPAELQGLIAAINHLAQQHEQAIRAVDARVIEAQRALVAERNNLAVLIAELPQGVLVCNQEGRVLLYNDQARSLLCPPRCERYIGLGRSVYDIVPCGDLKQAIGRLIARDGCGEIDPVVEFSVSSAESTAVRIRVAAVAGTIDPAEAATRPAGFVLLVETAAAHSAGIRTPAAERAPRPARPVFYDFELFQQTTAGETMDDQPLTRLAYTVLDTETTGLDPGAGDEIVAIAAVRIVNARIVAGDAFDCLLDPGRPIGSRARAIHGLSAEMLHGQPRIGAVLPGFHAYCADTVLVGHNVAFDLRFLQMKELATGVRFQQPVLDTLLLSAVLHEHDADDRLEAIAHRYGIEVIARHTALGDATITAEVFLKMLPLLARRGIVTLRQAHAASSRTRYARLRY